MKNHPLAARNLAWAAALLALMALLAGGAAWRESVAIDEVAPVGAGVSYLQRLDMRMNFEHPPLAKILAALPLAARGVRADYSHPSWTSSGTSFNSLLGEWSFGHWLITRWNELWSTMAWARAPMLLLTLALGFLIYWCGSRLGDVRGGVLCLAAYVSVPAFLAFGPLVLTDIAVTLFCLASLWTFASIWRSPTPAAAARFGVALAAALLSKFSAGLLLVSGAAFALSLRWLPAPPSPSAMRHAVCDFVSRAVVIPAETERRS
jgi:4-amino-4-deoxy-L-arabinose transferase-like glycosyltransferase